MQPISFIGRALLPVFTCLCVGVRGQVTFNLPSNPALVNITSAEYFFDTDNGPGTGTAIPLTAGTNVTISNFTINISGLSDGIHWLYVRAADAAGRWSFANHQPLFIIKAVAFPSNPGIANINAVEYFFDTDPGVGLGTSIPVTAGANVTVSNFSIPLTGLADGIHRLYLRARNANGVWSFDNYQPLFIVKAVVFPGNPGLTNITAAEYFFDTDPGMGSATPITVSSPGTNVVISQSISLGGLGIGVHRLYLRTRDAGGHWSLTNEQNLAILAPSLIIPSNPVPGNLRVLEYFFDTDPGFGNGTSVTIPVTTNLSDFTFPVDVSHLSNGTHILYVRVLDAWSVTTAVSMAIGTPLPITLLSFSGRLQPDNSVLLSWETVNETNNSYFGVERSGNGTDFTEIGRVPGSGTTVQAHDYSFSDGHPVEGINFYRLRQVDLDGRSSYSGVITVMVNSDKLFAIAPNPVQGMLTIHLGGTPSAGGMFRIMDLQGKVLRVISANQDNTQQVVVSDLAAGTYILQYLSTTQMNTTTFVKL
jgi:hypothetical protein